MASILSAGTTSATAMVHTADTSGVLQLASNNGTVALTIDTSQNVGIGTTSPLQKLDMNGATARFSNGSYIGYLGAGSLLVSGSASDFTLRSDNILSFGTGGPYERMRITTSGNLLVGTTTEISGFTTQLYNGTMFGDPASGFYISPTNTNTLNTYYLSDTDGANCWINYRGYLDGFTRFRNFTVANGKGSAIATFTGSSGNLQITGALSKGSGSFRIDHPLPELEETHQLVHSFIEGPQADLIYRGVVSLVNGKASINIDDASGMTNGTFEALCREVQCFTTNESDWVSVRGKVTGNIIDIEAQDLTANSTISWLVIGERKDKHMMNTGWTDENGKVIVEPLKPPKDPMEVAAQEEIKGA